MVDALLDKGTFQAFQDDLQPNDVLGFPGYPEAISHARAATGSDESVSAGRASIEGHGVVYAAFDFDFLGGSMGSVAGERLARAMEEAASLEVPLVLRTSTGGARMQEGMRSLVQMPKLVAARLALGEAGCPLIAIFGHPTTGGVLASVGALADIIIAEAGATVGFAGPRVAERSMGRPLSGTSHSAETAFAAGLVDEVVAPEELPIYLGQVLRTLAPDDPEPTREPPSLPLEAAGDPYEAVQNARAEGRAHAADLLVDVMDSYIVLHGDRSGVMDPSVDVAIGRIAGRRTLVIALDRTRSPGPGAYRKAKRAVDLAGRLRLPIVTLIDTRGADPSEESESGGIAWTLAELLAAMLSAPVPTLGLVLGEGGSGGALAFGATDRLLAYEGSIFSVIAPELAAEILWRDGAKAADAARLLKPTAHELVRLGIADGVIAEPLSADSLRATITYHLAELQEAALSPNERVAQRRGRWRHIDGA